MLAAITELQVHDFFHQESDQIGVASTVQIVSDLCIQAAEPEVRDSLLRERAHYDCEVMRLFTLLDADSDTALSSAELRIVVEPTSLATVAPFLTALYDDDATDRRLVSMDEWVQTWDHIKEGLGEAHAEVQMR